MKIDDTFDPFAPDNGSEYSVDKFYTRAYDKQGHAENVRIGTETIKVLPSIKSRMDAVRSRIPQFKSSADFIRDAIVHRLMYLESQDIFPEELSKEIKKYELIMRMDTKIAEQRSSVELVEGMRPVYYDVMARRQSFEANIQDFIDAAASLANYPEQQDQIVEMITSMIKRFGSED